MKKRKITGAILTFTTLVFLLIRASQRLALPVKAQSRTAQLSLSPASGGPYQVGNEFSVAVRLDASCANTTEYGNECGIAGADVRLNYDGTRLAVARIENHALDTEVAPATTSNGQIRVQRGDLNDVPPRSDLNLFTIVFTAIGSGTANVSFTSTTTHQIIGDFPGEIDKTIPVTAVSGGSYEVISSDPTPEPTIPPGEGRLNFNLRFQGVYVWRPDQEVQVTVRQGETTVVRTAVTVEAGTGGIYSGSLSGLAPGVYDILVKGPVHLQKKFAGVTLIVGENNQDWSGTKLLTGDAQVGGSSNNKVDIQDLSLLSQDFGSRMPSGGSLADLDFDSDVDVFDLTFISENFGQEGD